MQLVIVSEKISLSMTWFSALFWTLTFLHLNNQVVAFSYGVVFDLSSKKTQELSSLIREELAASVTQDICWSMITLSKIP